MRKPTRGALDAILSQAISAEMRDRMTTQIMALFEDNPKVKWEEEFDKAFGNSHLLVPEGVNLFDGKCHDVKAPIKDFIREKLRELYDDMKINGWYEGLKEKWGL